MSTYLYLDSNFRSNLNDSPTNYTISISQGNMWSALPKDINDGISSWSKTVIEIEDITLETFYIYPRPIMKFNVYDLGQFDNTTVNSLNPLDSFRFVVKENYNSFGWRSYNSNMAIPMTFKSKSTYKIDLMDINNTYPNDITRSIITIKMTPLERYNIKYKDIPYKNASLAFYSMPDHHPNP